jgi:hypothetical protein
MVSDKVYFTYNHTKPRLAEGGLMYTLLQQCNNEGWITKKTSYFPINDFVFDTEGNCNIQINITQKSSEDIQKIWVSSFIVKPNKIPMTVSNRDIYIELSKVLDLLDQPEYKDIYVEEYQGKKFKVEQYKIKRSSKLDLFVTNDKSQKYKGGIQKQLLSYTNGIGKTTVSKSSELSHPYQWAKNLLRLCNFCNLSSSSKYKQQLLMAIDQYINQRDFLSHIKNKSLYYLYPTPTNVVGVEIEKNWVSGLAQGYILSAFSCLCEKTGDNKYCEDATNVFTSYFDIKDYYDDNENNKLWFTYIDKDQFLWFQEVPQNQNKKKQFNILNGHLAAIAGLYSYYRTTQSPQALLLIRAGITTVKRYLHYFRNRNDTMGYFLYDPRIADYGPV